MDHLNGRILKMYNLEIRIKSFRGQKGSSSEPLDPPLPTGLVRLHSCHFTLNSHSLGVIKISETYTCCVGLFSRMPGIIHMHLLCTTSKGFAIMQSCFDQMWISEGEYYYIAFLIFSTMQNKTYVV